MKIWKDAQFNPFDWVGNWERLTLETRQQFLSEIGSDLKVDGHVFSVEARRQLLKSGFMQPCTQRLKEECRPFRNFVRSMNRHRHFDRSSKELPVDYVSDYLTSYECSEMPNFRGFRYGRNAKMVADEVIESNWLKAFIECKSRDEWEIRKSIHSQFYFSEDSFGLLQRWVERLLGGVNPLPLAALLEDAGGDAGLAADALRGAIRYMLLFPALDEASLLPVAGIWPSIHQRMTRTKAAAPDAGELPEGFRVYEVPLLMNDMTAFLVVASGEGLLLKADGVSLFKKEEARLGERMLDDPPPACGYKPPQWGRIHYAKEWLVQMKLLSVRGKKKEKRLVATENGRSWLAGSASERLKELHDHVLLARKHFSDGRRSYDEIAFVPHNPQYYVGKGGMNLEDRVAQVFAACPVGEWIDRDAFLKWQTEAENPFLLSLDASIERIFYNSWSKSDAYREDQWRRLLHDFLYERLLLLGGVRLACDGLGDIRFSMTSAGAYLVGARHEFEYAAAEITGTILVQPDFEIIFTAPNPHAESELVRFSERIGNGVGALFRITRRSVLNALDSGQTGEQVCGVLQSLCGAAVPDNVQKQIMGWGKAFRQVSIRQIQVIDCPDAETALLVCGLFPKKVSRLTDTLVQIEGTNKTLEPMKKVLRQNGIGIR